MSTFDAGVTFAIALVSLATVGACRSTATTRVAVGARGAIPTWAGPCTPTASAAVTFPSASRYEAVRAGTVRLTCRDGDVVLDVTDAASIAIDAGPTARVGEHLSYRAIVRDVVGHQLDVGDEKAMSWSFGGALAVRSDPGCGDVIPICPSKNTGFARAASPGTGTIEATFRGLRATASVRVAP